MMYLQWLVHGRPDAYRPTPAAVAKSHEVIQKFQNEGNYQGAVELVSSFGKVFANRTEQFCGEDWYRLRRTLEIALTVQEQAEESNDDSQKSNNDAHQKRMDELVENLYTGERHGGLASLGYDVRCFFLCPDDRMGHTKIIDRRCEQMVIKGLITETTDLSLSGCLPEMAERAIGYRQTLDYLNREKGSNETEEEIFDNYLNDFTTATRRYAKKQMAWFRKDQDFMFVPVSLELDKTERVNAVAKEIIRYCRLSNAEYERELRGEETKSTECRKENELQGKNMKFYQFERHILKQGSESYADALAEGIECRRRIRMSKKKRTIEETLST